MAPPRLMEQVRTEIRARHYSRRTEDAYVHWIRRFIVFHGRRHPRELGASEISAFVSSSPMHSHASIRPPRLSGPANLSFRPAESVATLGSVRLPGFTCTTRRCS